MCVSGTACRSGLEVVRPENMELNDGGSNADAGEPDGRIGVPQFGTGRDGAFVLPLSGSVPINDYFPVVNMADDSGELEVLAAAARNVEASDLILVLQTQEEVPTDPSPLDSSDALDTSDLFAGTWEFARVASAEGDSDTRTLTLESPLTRRFDAAHTQVIRVPEFSSFFVPEGAELSGRSWDGRDGGMIVFLVSGELRVDGTIAVSEQGFRGGEDPPATIESGNHCDQPDAPAPNGAPRGEGLYTEGYGREQTGFGNLAQGGGGATCGGGGGGGSNAGMGGDGTGHGGAPIQPYDTTERLLLGGGGGAGTSGPGGTGGGVLLFRSDTLAGTGALEANGERGSGASGAGGAGGTIRGVVRDVVTCPAFRANGGTGHNDLSSRRGGGGGGGLIYLEIEQGRCAGSVEGGRSGGNEGEDGVLGGSAFSL